MTLDYNPDDIDVKISELLIATSDSADPELPAAVPEVLRLIRSKLKMDVAFVSEITDGTRTFKAVDSIQGFTPHLEAGMSGPAEASWCQHVVEGRLPEVMRDAAPFVASGQAPDPGFAIGTHLSTPVRRADGSVYGTLCCFSRGVKADTDIDLLRRTAHVLAAKLGTPPAAARA